MTTYLIFFFLYILGPLLLCYIYFILLEYTHWNSYRDISLPRRRIVWGFGHFFSVFRLEKSLATFCYELHTENSDLDKFVGLYFLHIPALLIRDINLANEVLYSKIEYFRKPFVAPSVKMDPLLCKIPPFSIKNDWMLRIFNDQYKRHIVFHYILVTCNHMQGYFSAIIKHRDSTRININYFMAEFTRKIMINVGLGISNENESAMKDALDVITSVQKAFQPGLYNLFCVLKPSLANFLRMRLISKKIDKKFRDLVFTLRKEAVKQGASRMMWRDSVLHWLGAMETDNETLIAQLFTFFVETQVYLHTLGSFALYHLARNTWIQNHARGEVLDILGEDTNTWTYENLVKVGILERIIQETLRLHGPFGCISRVCTRVVRLDHGGQGCWLYPGNIVFISAKALNQNPLYCGSHPKAFNPDRFLDHNHTVLYPNEGITVEHSWCLKTILKMLLATVLATGQIMEEDEGSLSIPVDETAYITRLKNIQLIIS